MKRLYQTVVTGFIGVFVVGIFACPATAADRADQMTTGPLNATYRIDGQPVGLADGQCERPAAPGSATIVRTSVWKQPVYGDLDGRGDEDAALVLVHDPGGSGTFYFAAAALNTDGRYRGTRGVLLGDRIVPTAISIRDRQLVVDYTDRLPDEPFSAAPSVDRTMVLVVRDGHLLAVASGGKPEQETRGWVTIGHEVRIFKPCDGEDELWLIGQPPALKAIGDAYRQAESDPKHYRPVLMALVGEQVYPPTHGFGAEYAGAFQATRLVRVETGASCGNPANSDDSVQAVSHKVAFDISALDDEGLWGPKGGKRAVHYEFCIPDTVENRTEVQLIDPTVTFFSESPGRIDCAEHEVLCIASSHQQNVAGVLQQLTELPYVRRIQHTFFE